MKNLLFTLTFFSFVGYQAQQTEYSYIKKIVSANGKNAITVDAVQYLTGKEAVQAAKKKGVAEKSYNKNGKLEYFVPNDYFVLNESKKTKQITLSKDCKIQMISIDNDLPRPKQQTFSFLKTHFQNKIFKMSLDKTGTVKKIEEVYQP